MVLYTINVLCYIIKYRKTGLDVVTKPSHNNVYKWKEIL